MSSISPSPQGEVGQSHLSREYERKSTVTMANGVLRLTFLPDANEESIAISDVTHTRGVEPMRSREQSGRVLMTR
jgi:hypothetical protein